MFLNTYYYYSFRFNFVVTWNFLKLITRMLSIEYFFWSDGFSLRSTFFAAFLIQTCLSGRGNCLHCPSRVSAPITSFLSLKNSLGCCFERRKVSIPWRLFLLHLEKKIEIQDKYLACSQWQRKDLASCSPFLLFPHCGSIYMFQIILPGLWD